MFEFTRNEIRDLIIAYIVLTIAFAISNVGLDAHGFISILPIIMVGVGIGFLLHELGHKFMAVKHGYFAEFKMWPLGLVIALATAFIGFVFAAPGTAQPHETDISDDVLGKIFIAGPMINIVLAILFIAIAALIYPFSINSTIITLIYLICTVGYSVNCFLAAFNLLPIPTFDGIKVFKWNKGLWLVTFVIAAVMMLMSITIGAEDMVMMLIGT